MSFRYKLAKTQYAGEDIVELVKKFNSATLPDRMVNKVIEEFEEHNPNARTGDEILIPILPFHYDKYQQLFDKDYKLGDEPTDGYRVGSPHPITEPAGEQEAEEPPIEEIVVEDTEQEVPTHPAEPQEKVKVAYKGHVEPTEKMKYRVYEYTFSRPGETIEAVIRLYNDMNLNRAILNKLLFTFTKLNEGSMPPKLGQTVKVPVLLPFCYRHENKNKIFNDDK